MSAFWRVPIRGGGFAYHWGTKRDNVDTGIREQDVRPQRFVRRGVEYRNEQAALDAWKAEQKSEAAT